MSRTITAAELLAECEAGRTAHMETRPVRGKYDPAKGDDIVRDRQGKVVTEDVLVPDVEVRVDGAWHPLRQVSTDDADPDRPVFIDYGDPPHKVDDRGGRLALAGVDELRVRDIPGPRS